MTNTLENAGVKVREYDRSTYAVWEITLKCNLACSHCGSRAGDKRADELSTTEAFDLIKQMADLGVKEVTLIGGEAYLRPDWLMIASEIKNKGMRVTMTTGGYGISRGTAKRMAQAGIEAVSVSIDGLEDEHNSIRGKSDSWSQCFTTLSQFKDLGVHTGVNTTVTRKSAKDLPLLYEKLIDVGVKNWRIQLAVPMGNAADNNEMLMQPYELLDLYPLLGLLSVRGRKDDLIIQPGNNVGYFGPYERLLRGTFMQESKYSFYTGCVAGQGAIGIEADGKIKGCPSLPSEEYTGGNIRERTLKDIYENAPELNFNSQEMDDASIAHLWGNCKGCKYAKLCRAGCNWTAHVFFGKRGNNPYCHHRALTLAASGLRERFQQRVAASGIPFDHGVFEIYEESISATSNDNVNRFTIQGINFPPSWLATDSNLRERLNSEKLNAIHQYRALGLAKAV
ncbi:MULTISPECIES: radical SAM protein [Pseudoalteromonas]|uniref:radical SAM/SPASM domain-containing protein n=1 Tax=Pseudoalteromonas TaxID=53246 RepID=UPI000299E2E5|nr:MULTISPECIES: radical SAM protein [Pseudoalteromonas]ASD68804.1 radical SAM/SPASM domain-containing protein [Pseudoalteromonas piscicida]AUJ71760.1 Antilisterial bacteriocin subtilosin biosynthesis protein AlbA [Pseudoalteromonas sp. NC201]MBR8845653.1 radical SAM protein [Pseudoalteromonas sp. JC3]MCG7554266.1 radical SAM protein [Pseudoalteromonas sp. Of11M-6]NSY34777.1 radical SAM protein [Pseudoalteromonas sp. JC28]